VSIVAIFGTGSSGLKTIRRVFVFHVLSRASKRYGAATFDVNWLILDFFFKIVF
jgi:hypothetical protein